LKSGSPALPVLSLRLCVTYTFENVGKSRGLHSVVGIP